MGKRYMQLIEDMLKHCQATLASKHKEYANEESDYHNFDLAAALQSCIPERALIGMMDKHVVSVHDMVTAMENGWKPYAAYVQEKIGDNINYLLILYAMILERMGDANEPDD